MNRFGPTRGELKFRLAFSLFGLAALAGALIYRGLPQGPAMFEIIAIAGTFFGGSAGWTTWKLIRRDHP